MGKVKVGGDFEIRGGKMKKFCGATLPY